MPGKLLKRLEQLNTKDCLWMYILRILHEKETHAYMLRSEIKKRFGFTPGTVTAYRVIYYLVSKGLVSKRAEGRRKVYSITERGKEELKKAVNFYKKQAKELYF